MKRAISILLAVAILVAYQLPTISAAGQNTGELSGTAMVGGKPLPNVTVRLRNVDNGQVVGSMTTNERGEFRFTGLPPGNFVVEIVGENGRLVAASARIGLASGIMTASSVTVTTSAAAAAAAGLGAGAAAAGVAGAASVVGAATGAIGVAVGGAASGGFFASTLGIVTLAAVVAGIGTAAVAARGDASPSQ
jgi:Carboxypeptidase regulatory-like domain